jgi:hypothetical protein
MKPKLGLPLLLLPFLLTLAAPGNAAQSLRAGGNALVQTLAGNANDWKEQDWLSSPGGPVVRETSVQVGGTRASMSFTADFGVLRGDLKATVSGAGPLWAQAGGTFESFSNFVGASFADRITLAGAGLVSVVVSASLHSVIGDPNGDTTSEVKLKIDAYRNGLTRIDLAPATHNVTGETTTTRTFTVNGTAGDYFDLYADLSGLVTARMREGMMGEYVAFADASHTGMVTITAQTGSFTSASGALYTAPIPEPGSWALMMLGLVTSGLWVRSRTRPVPLRPLECSGGIRRS